MGNKLTITMMVDLVVRHNKTNYTDSDNKIRLLEVLALLILMTTVMM